VVRALEDGMGEQSLQRNICIILWGKGGCEENVYVSELTQH
jgi:hypothetical protein